MPGMSATPTLKTWQHVHRWPQAPPQHEPMPGTFSYKMTDSPNMPQQLGQHRLCVQHGEQHSAGATFWMMARS